MKYLFFFITLLAPLFFAIVAPAAEPNYYGFSYNSSNQALIIFKYQREDYTRKVSLCRSLASNGTRIEQLENAIAACAVKPQIVSEVLTLNTTLELQKKNFLHALIFKLYKGLIKGFEAYPSDQWEFIFRQNRLQRMLYALTSVNIWPSDESFFYTNLIKRSIIPLEPEFRACDQNEVLTQKGKKYKYRVLSFYDPMLNLVFFDFNQGFYEGFFTAVHELSHRQWQSSFLRYEHLLNLSSEHLGLLRLQQEIIGDKHGALESLHYKTPALENELVAFSLSLEAYQLFRPIRELLLLEASPVAEGWKNSLFTDHPNIPNHASLASSVQKTYTSETRYSFYDLSKKKPWFYLAGAEYKYEPRITFSSRILSFLYGPPTNYDFSTPLSSDEVQNYEQSIYQKFTKIEIKKYRNASMSIQWNKECLQSMPFEISELIDGGSEGIHTEISTMDHPLPLMESK